MSEWVVNVYSFHSWSKYFNKSAMHGLTNAQTGQFSANLAMLGWSWVDALTELVKNPSSLLPDPNNPVRGLWTTGVKILQTSYWLLRNIKSSRGGQGWSKDGCVRLGSGVQGRFELWRVSRAWFGDRHVLLGEEYFPIHSQIGIYAYTV